MAESPRTINGWLHRKPETNALGTDATIDERWTKDGVAYFLKQRVIHISADIREPAISRILQDADGLIEILRTEH
jgi:hypothetical protein